MPRTRRTELAKMVLFFGVFGFSTLYRSYFHAECIRPWLERNPSCPLCRDALPQLVRPTTPMPQGTGNPLLDLWFLAMAMQRQERENMTRQRQSNGPSLADLQGPLRLPPEVLYVAHAVSFSSDDAEVFTYVPEHNGEVLEMTSLTPGCKWIGRREHFSACNLQLAQINSSLWERRMQALHLAAIAPGH
eukprot:s700_g18.t1